MQYLLSEEEMAEIRADRLAISELPGAKIIEPGKISYSITRHLQALTETCRAIAIATTPDWRDKPYGCIHVNRRESYGYCDRCPVLRICPQPKDFSK